jgi:hypothetical protein
MYNVKKRLVWVFYNRGKRDKNNEISLKEARVIEMSTTVLSIYAMHRSPSLFVFYLPRCSTNYRLWL